MLTSSISNHNIVITIIVLARVGIILDDFRLADSLGYIINRTALRLKNELHKGLRPFDVTPDQWGLLAQLSEADGISQRELADKAGKDQPTITRILDLLEKKKLILRQPDPSNRRATLVFITKEGKLLTRQMIPVAWSILAEALDGISKEEEDILKSLLNKVFANINRA